MKYLAYALATILLINGLASQPATAPSPGSARVGTFDPRAVAIAYYRSPLHAEHLRALKADHDGSKAAGDTGRAEKLEAQGRAEQELAHRQGFGNGPYDSLAAQLAP